RSGDSGRRPRTVHLVNTFDVRVLRNVEDRCLPRITRAWIPTRVHVLGEALPEGDPVVARGDHDRVSARTAVRVPRPAIRGAQRSGKAPVGVRNLHAAVDRHRGRAWTRRIGARARNAVVDHRPGNATPVPQDNIYVLRVDLERNRLSVCKIIASAEPLVWKVTRWPREIAKKNPIRPGMEALDPESSGRIGDHLSAGALERIVCRHPDVWHGIACEIADRA